MVEVTTRILKWGNSYGIVIPQEVVKRKGLKEGEEVDAILIKKGNVLKETFGTAKSKKSIDKMLKEADKELYDI
ncbi:AbrB/MazE/SpoVT family DNA-binding domain-containing protein [Candidatus Pacearchaeota archaeon]|nr:AbrB/MazE/SpoVT family DNA-binding domain-containing protein [Candidatus Pacearchaeota archaeon]